ncbi:hypothetical protein [Caballeronia telluris]|uniref:Plasmid related protein n=1 Tax=Caballeronia telluris TaxID=326475 RepID=A0A158FIJ1_9BURK|nr:hypothetical protein [Caballeronia telluris]SAL19766.1 plasmid related protein [Caballeronia telluris]
MSRHTKNGARFPMGELAITPAAQAALDAAGILSVLLLARHIHGDWGDLHVEDLAANELAVLTGKRLLSSYALPGGGKVWIITEADRSATTIMLPDDY